MLHPLAPVSVVTLGAHREIEDRPEDPLGPGGDLCFEKCIKLLLPAPLVGK